MRDISLHVNVSWNVYDVSDTVEKRACLPSALGQTLQHLSAHRIILDSILVMGMGGTLHVGGRRDPGGLHQGSHKSGVLAEAELGRCRKDR